MPKDEQDNAAEAHEQRDEANARKRRELRLTLDFEQAMEAVTLGRAVQAAVTQCGAGCNRLQPHVVPSR